MKTLLIAAAVLVTGAFSANAQPIAPRAVLPSAAQADLVQQVDWACGPGWRLNRWGDCVPRRGPPPRHFHRDRDWGWGPPPPRYRPPPPPPRGWGPPPRHWGPPDRW